MCAAHFGVCHLCRLRLGITWCRDCGHWFCEACKKRTFWRGFAWVMDLVMHALFRFPYLEEDCCGPNALTNDELELSRRT